MVWNLMTGEGFVGGAYSTLWIKCWVAVVALAIVPLFDLLLKVKDDSGLPEPPIPFNYQGALLGALIAIITITFTGSYKIGFILGLVGFGVGGYLMGLRSGG
jgi:hypothetical protein